MLIKPKFNCSSINSQDRESLLENDEIVEAQQKDRVKKARTRSRFLTVLLMLTTLLGISLLTFSILVLVTESTAGRTSEAKDGNISIVITSTTPISNSIHQPISDEDKDATPLIVTEEEEEKHVITNVYIDPLTDGDDAYETFTDDTENNDMGSAIDDSSYYDESSGDKTEYEYGYETYSSGSAGYYHYHDDDIDLSYLETVRENVYPYHMDEVVLSENLTDDDAYNFYKNIFY